jgi:hypothetical protein
MLDAKTIAAVRKAYQGGRSLKGIAADLRGVSLRQVRRIVRAVPPAPAAPPRRVIVMRVKAP